MCLKDNKKKYHFLAALFFCFNSFAFDFDSCKSSLQDVVNETNQLASFGTDLMNSRESLVSIGKYSEANQLAMPSLMVPIVRGSAFGLFTIGIFYDALDPSIFEKKNAQNLYTHRMNDFYTDVAVFLTYFEKVAPLIENASSREDLKKIGMELRKLKAKYRYCEK